jgi:hypothetical protein
MWKISWLAIIVTIHDLTMAAHVRTRITFQVDLSLYTNISRMIIAFGMVNVDPIQEVKQPIVITMVQQNY